MHTFGQMARCHEEYSYLNSISIYGHAEHRRVNPNMYSLRSEIVVAMTFLQINPLYSSDTTRAPLCPLRVAELDSPPVTDAVASLPHTPASPCSAGRRRRTHILSLHSQAPLHTSFLSHGVRHRERRCVGEFKVGFFLCQWRICGRR